MPQLQLPIFPEGVTHITPELAFEKRDGQVTYFTGLLPVFRHDEKDLRTFRMITSQFCVNGNAKQAAIARAFGVPLITVKRGVKTYRTKGAAGFYEVRRTRGAAVLTPIVLEQAQTKLDEGISVVDVATQLGLKLNTVQKAIRAGRLRQAAKKKGARRFDRQ